MSSPVLAQRLGVTRQNVYGSVRNERAGTISLGQLDRMADAMGGKLFYPIIPREVPVAETVMAQARRTAKRIILRTPAQMALEEQMEGLRSQEEMV